VVLLVAHGSRLHSANEAHARLCHEVSERAGSVVRPAFLELAEPSIPDAIDAAVAAGAVTVRLLPHFLHAGRHLVEDIPRLVAEAQARHTGTATVVLEGHTGAHDAMIELLADLAGRAQ
jgi:sirohydrochlorin ferrochelatase